MKLLAWMLVPDWLKLLISLDFHMQHLLTFIQNGVEKKAAKGSAT